jgi:hypothetical protein
MVVLMKSPTIRSTALSTLLARGRHQLARSDLDFWCFERMASSLGHWTLRYASRVLTGLAIVTVSWILCVRPRGFDMFRVPVTRQEAYAPLYLPDFTTYDDIYHRTKITAAILPYRVI